MGRNLRIGTRLLAAAIILLPINFIAADAGAQGSTWRWPRLSPGAPAPQPQPQPQPQPAPQPVPPSLPGAPQGQAPATFPSTADGRPVSQIGVQWWWDSQVDEPFLNLARLKGVSWSAQGPWGPNGAARLDEAQFWAGGHVDPATLYPRRMPDGMERVWGGRFRVRADARPAYYAGTYVLDWEGDGDLAFDAPTCSRAGQTNCQRAAGPRRREITYAPTDVDAGRWAFMRIESGGVRNVRLYRAENEARLNAGEVFSPAYLAVLKRYKVVRFMDVQTASEARPFRAGDRFAAPSMASWAPDWEQRYAGAPAEVSFELMLRAAVAAEAAAWVHVAPLPGAPADPFDRLVSPADPALWREACKAHAPTILGARADWAAYMDAIVSGLAASGYPADRMLYLEPWNEVWNWAGPWARMTFCGSGIADWLDQSGKPTPPGNRWRVGYGYLAAHAMTEFDAALARAGRKQAYTLVIGSHNSWLAQTEGALSGFARYFADRGLDAKPWARHAGVSTASYYGGAFSPRGFMRRAGDPSSGVSEAENLARWKAAIAADPAGLARRLTDWHLTEDVEDMTVVWGVRLKRAHQAMAEKAGHFLVGDYEGESHDDIPANLAADPAVKRWIDGFIVGPEGERLTRGWGRANATAFPGAIIANYGYFGVRNADGSVPVADFDRPWIDAFPGEENGRTRGLKEIER